MRKRNYCDTVMEYIRSAHNTTFKEWTKFVHSRQARYNAQQTFIEGIHLIEAAQQYQYPLRQLIISESFQSSSSGQDLLAKCTSPVVCMPDKLFSKLSSLVTPVGVIALIDLPVKASPKKAGLIVALEAVQDPGNVGTIMRTAVACGVTQVWLDKKCADVWSSKVLRAGMGAHFAIECILDANLLEALTEFQGKTLATTLHTKSEWLYDVDLIGDLVLVFGNEGAGVSPAVCQKAKGKVAIPMQPGIESLNVGTAVAVCLYERYRQQYFLNKTFTI